MGKRRYGEGIFTLLTEAVLASGAYITYNFAKDQVDIMKNPNTTYTDYMTAKDKYGNLKQMNNICLGAAAAVYALNLYRAYAAKPRYKKSYALVPTMMPTDNCMAYGVSLTYNF